MIKALLFCFVILFHDVSDDLKKIRKNYSLISKQKESVAAIKEIALTSKNILASTKQAYYAAAEMSSAQYKINPAAKLNAFNTGKKILESTIAADTNNLEARYIRYTIQQNAPSFLGYNKNILNDKKFLIQHLISVKTIDSELYSNVYAYLLTYGKLSEQEKAKISN